VKGLTKELCEPLRLIVVFHSHAAGVQEHQQYHKPVEHLLKERTISRIFDVLFFIGFVEQAEVIVGQEKVY